MNPTTLALTHVDTQKTMGYFYLCLANIFHNFSAKHLSNIKQVTLGPGNQQDKMIKTSKQNDCITCSIRMKRTLLNSSSSAGTNTASDHRPVISRCDTRPYQMYPAKRFKTEPKTQVQRLVTEGTTRQMYQQELTNRLEDKIFCIEVLGALRKLSRKLLINESDGATKENHNRTMNALRKGRINYA